jgi:predicted nucleic acid-binding protein
MMLSVMLTAMSGTCDKDGDVMLIDTDVLVWYLRGNHHAYDVIEGQPGFSLSVITYMELVQGMRNKRELQELERAIQRWHATILHVNETISTTASAYVTQHYLSHALELADALIGATAVVHQLPLLTANDKHYTVIHDITIEIFRP